MSYDIKQSTTAYPLVFLMVDSTDHVTGKTGLTPTVTISKAGGSFASPSGAVSEIANGWYKVAGNATDTGTLGPLILHATGTAADPVDILYNVIAYDPQDTVRLGLTAMPNVASGNSGAIVTAGTGTAQISTSSGQVILQTGTGTGQLDFTSGVVKANVTQFGGSAGTFASGRPEVNTTHISGSAVSTSSAQIGVNVVNFGGSAGTFASGRPEVNMTHIKGTSSAGTAGYAGIDWSAVNAPTSVVGLTGTTISTGQTITSVSGAVGSVTGNVGGNVVGSVASVTARVTANTDQLAGQTVTAAAGVTFPTSVASPTNITAGTITTVTNLTNAATAGDFTSTMKTSIGTAVAASAVASVTGNVGGNVTGSVGSLATQAKADVNAEVVDAINVDTYAEPGQGTPAATLSLASKIGYLFKAWRNKSTQTSSAYNLYNDDAATVDQKATTSDDGTTFSRGEIATGP